VAAVVLAGSVAVVTVVFSLVVVMVLTAVVVKVVFVIVVVVGQEACVRVSVAILPPAPAHPQSGVEHTCSRAQTHQPRMRERKWRDGRHIPCTCTCELAAIQHERAVEHKRF
jgi:hypothetical protein